MRFLCVFLPRCLLLGPRLAAGEPASAVATVTAGYVTAITVTTGGSGYVQEPSVTLSGGGGSGATARAILNGDKVALVVILTAGSGYTSSPAVAIEAPPKVLGIRMELIPKLTVEGPAGALARVESATVLAGPWEAWTNVAVGAEGTVLVDLRAVSTARFYRAVPGAPAGPAGFVWIPPGRFTMGSPLSETERDADAGENQHVVTLTMGFWMQDHEVTRGEFWQVAGGADPGNTSALPVSLDWNAAVQYCQKMTARDRASGKISPGQAYRLPTEAEWEYAAQAGATTTRYGNVDAIAWHEGNSGGVPHPVKQKQPNAWGLYDMLGNEYEWCSDGWAELPAIAQTDPFGPPGGLYKVLKGGSWSDESTEARFANRNAEVSSEPSGFRPVLSKVL